jgi:hypothetical protein
MLQIEAGLVLPVQNGHTKFKLQKRIGVALLASSLCYFYLAFKEMKAISGSGIRVAPNEERCSIMQRML